MRESAFMRVWSLSPSVLSLVSLVAAQALAADATVGYAQATGYFKHDTRPTLYQPLNLLDARDATAWCSPNSDPLNELLSFGFNGVVKIDELKISTGNAFDQSTFDGFARAKKLQLVSGKQKRIITLEDKKGPQSITISPPISGARFTIEILDQYPAEDSDASVCITDIVFSSEGHVLNGPWLTQKLKYDKNISQVLGVWFAGYDNTPDRFLAFNFDGTFRYTFEPYDATRAKPETIEGTYDVTSSRLTFTIGGKRRATKWAKDPGKKGLQLTFDGDVPEALKQTFRSVP